MGVGKFGFLTGKTIGDWLVTDQHRGKYTCECVSCGNIRKYTGRVLYEGKVTRCTCKEGLHGFIDMTNKQVFEWHVNEYVGNKKWLCTCSCGTHRIISGYILRSGKTTSCGHKESLVGKHFNDWEVVGVGTKKGYWLCKCSCGTIKEVREYSLKKEISKSCGHATTGLKDLTGMDFDEWYVNKRLDSRGNYECICSCGEVRTVSGYALRSGSSKSCGHKANEIRKETCKIVYGVPFVSQRNSSRTIEQIESTSDNANVIKIIEDLEKEKGGKKPTIFDFCQVTGMDRGSAHYFLKKRGLLERFSINSNASHYEDELDEMFPGANRRARILDGAEIDLYYPNYNFGIEFNGNHWHNDSKKNKDYHKDKSLRAYKKGIDIFHIFEYEWNDPSKHNKIIQEISRRLNLESINNVDIKSCKTLEVDGETCNNFFKKYSLLENPDSNCGIAISLGGEVIGMLGFKKMDELEYQWEMVGIALADGYNLKDLSSAFKQFITAYNPDNIVTYCDFYRESGRALGDLGFIRRNISEPRFVRYDEYLQDVVYPKMDDENDPKCEGYSRIYDCGILRLVWYRTGK